MGDILSNYYDVWNIDTKDCEDDKEDEEDQHM